MKFVKGIVYSLIVIGAVFNIIACKADKERFISEKEYLNLKKQQVEMNSQTIDQLRNLGVSKDKNLKIEYFFYTNKLEKAKNLTNEITKLNYIVKYDVSAGDKKLFVITGWTEKMKMTNTIIDNWSEKMCEIGYKNDCEFDGWGTDPNQN